MELNLKRVVECYGDDPVRVRRVLRNLSSTGGVRFCEGALALLEGSPQGTAYDSLAEALAMNEALPDRLCDPSRYSLEEALQLANRLFAAEPLLDAILARRLFTSDGAGGALRDAAAERTLELLEGISDGVRVLPFVLKLLSHASPRIRSKAALMAGRANNNTKWTEERMSEPDDRVRANTVEAFWGVSESVRALLERGTRDSNNRVQGNAWVELYRSGEIAAIGALLEMARHPDARFRRTAAWAMGETGDARFAPVLREMLHNAGVPQATVLRALTQIRKRQTAAAGGPGLSVTVCGYSQLQAGLRKVTAAAASPGGKRLSSLPATSVVLWEDERPVSEYSVLPCREACAPGAEPEGIKFEIIYRPEPGFEKTEPKEVRLQVFAQDGYGENALAPGR